VAELFQAYGLTEGQATMTELIVVFRNFAKVKVKVSRNRPRWPKGFWVG